MMKQQTRLQRGSMHSCAKGFTLIEMLVVLVIVALTTSLLAQGLATTWKNFERLGARALMQSSAQLPALWVTQSVQGALMYHPNQAVAQGSDKHFEFITFLAPDDEHHLPQSIRWQFQPANPGWQLSYQKAESAASVVVQLFEQEPNFSYLVDGQWQAAFTPNAAQLPQAIKILVGEQTWLLASPGRPAQVDIPPELPIFGDYDFGQ
ncbi:hypothetical protein GCM10010982_01010 [Bowmanella pacifica]|uniref:Prepilin-type N-terminal cleavage/methylation domain-containing protein n=2 Tax=Bowmanella pacifica TaxID=502051 RepID=A0A918DGE5_9ALTE|nr:hypothetical protein GCM10010982_01010 [Bowmanella pacifica]